MHWLLDGHDRNGRGILVYNARHIVPCLTKNGSVARMQLMGSYLMQQAIRRKVVRVHTRTTIAGTLVVL